MQNLHQFQAAFKAYLSGEVINKEPQELYDPVNYILGLGGKQLRPVVLLMAYSLFDEDFEKSLPAAMAIEVFHNFTLLHDDIMDSAPLRRGKPTVHEKYDVNTAILSGDVMFVYSYQYLLRMKDAPHFHTVLDVFTRTCIEVCEGQQMDMNFETRTDVSIEEYIEMITLKTSVLVAGAMEIGALLAGAPLDDAEHVAQFGRNLGIAFQLQDDLLDTFGDPKKFGKKVGGDIAQNKKTFLYLKALEMASSEVQNELRKLYEDTGLNEEEKISRVISIFEDLAIKEQTEKMKKEYWELSMSNLDKVNISTQKRGLLSDFATALMQREF